MNYITPGNRSSAEPMRSTSPRYRGPIQSAREPLTSLLAYCGRSIESERQLGLLQRSDSEKATVFFAGDKSLLKMPSVSIVGTRDVSEAGWKRASRLARELSSAGIAVMSGLAKGVDTAAHISAIESGGATIAVIGTPLDKAYPAENARLQEKIFSDYLLLSPFYPGEPTFKSSFPKRNRVMALLSDATIIVEASDTSGTLHQAAECQRQGRHLYILRSVADDKSLSWPARFLGKNGVSILEDTNQIVEDVLRWRNSR